MLKTRQLVIFAIASIGIALISSSYINKSISMYYKTPQANARVLECGSEIIPDDSILEGNWWPGENWGRWTKNGQNDFIVTTNAESFKVLLKLQWVTKDTQFNLIKVKNAKLLDTQKTDSEYVVSLKKISVDKEVKLSFLTSGATQPFAVDRENPDFRKLGAGIMSLKVLC